MAFNRISFETKDKVAYIGFGVNSIKSMTVLDKETLEELNEAAKTLQEMDKSKTVQGVIFFSHLPNVFLAGADINLISSLNTESEGSEGAAKGQELYNIIEDLNIPTIACVDGPCLGGGLELALACKIIICSDSPKTIFALPEVKLGLIPGFGGTYRLPKRLGLPAALDLILTGKNLRAKKAKRLGLVDEIYAKERLLKMAPKHLFQPVQKKKKQSYLNRVAVDNIFTRKIIFQQARKTVLKKTKGFYQAPLKILDVMENGTMRGRASYLLAESQAFGELCVSEQSKGLQHIFFLSEASKKYKGPAIQEETVSVPEIKRGIVLGAGTMGGGIAWLMANAGMKPVMKDINNDALELGLKQASSIFSKAFKRKHITYDEFERKQRSITPQLDYRGFKNMHLLIEAVVENIEIKKKVFSEVETQVSDNCIITSNTSSLSVTEMAKALQKPERFAGLHFFNPVNMMPLVEIITHDKVDPNVVKALHQWCLKVKKTPVIVKDGPGFLVNRILAPFLNESVHLLEEGVTPKDLDDACTNFGMPMGPCRLLDEVGLDISAHAAKTLHDAFGDRMRPSALVPKIINDGFLGKKNHKGFYVYDDKDKSIRPNEEIFKFLPKNKIKMEEADIQKRVILPMINEAASILDDKIVDNAANVDLGMIFGIGFPPFRGGLLRYADSEGLDKILQTLNDFAEKVDSLRYQPSEYLKNLVNNNKKFYDS